MLWWHRVINNQIHCLLYLIQRAASALYDFGKADKALSRNMSGRVPVVEQIHMWEIWFFCDTSLAWVLICIWGKRNQDIYSREQKRRGRTIRKPSYCLCLPAVELLLLYTNVHRRRYISYWIGEQIGLWKKKILLPQDKQTIWQSWFTVKISDWKRLNNIPMS